MIVYCSCIGYIFKERKNVAFHTRSPYIIIIGLTFLCVDSILNTFIFSAHSNGDVYAIKCNLGIIATCIGLFGYLMSLVLRMWRVYQVYKIYTEFLDNQKRALGIKSSQHLEIVKKKNADKPTRHLSAHRRNYQESIETHASSTASELVL